MHYYSSKEAQVFFYNLNNDLFTINLDLPTTRGWNVATSMNLNCYNFTASKGDSLLG
jgi:hypothetical protein